MIKHKLFTLLVALCATTALWASNTITYTATEKLEETTDTWSAGLHTNAFDVSISSHTFSNGVGTVTFAGEVTTIGELAFAGCSGLTSVTIPNSVTTIEGYAFDECSALTSITIPNSVTTIGDGAFSGCSGLTSVTIPNSVTTIGSWAFCNCSGLTSVTIPNSVTTIGSWAFEGCSGLTSVTCEATTPPACGRDCFYDVDKSIPLYVPTGSVDAYKTADEWKDFTDIRPISTAIENINANVNADVNTHKFLHNGQVIIRQGNKTYNVVGQEVK